MEQRTKDELLALVVVFMSVPVPIVLALLGVLGVVYLALEFIF